MTSIRTSRGALTAGALVLAALFGGNAVATGTGSDDQAPPTALVVDASLGRDGRELVDPRLKHVDAEVRLPRDAEEARTNVRYFDHLGYDVVVAGPQAVAASASTGVAATRVAGLDEALSLASR
jgi:hypothetical protein